MSIRDQLFAKYNSVHGQYLDEETSSRQWWFDRLAQESYLPHLPNKNGDLLEIGCGVGHILKFLKKAGYRRVGGLDLSGEEVKRARAYTQLTTIRRADAKSFLLKNPNSYDYIIGKDIVEHLDKDDLEPFFRAVVSGLKNGGQALFQVPNMDWIVATHERYLDYTHESGFTKESFAQVLRLYFDEVNIYPVNYDFPYSWKSWIAFRIFKPLTIKLTRLWLTFLGASAQAVWFEYREILAVAKVKKPASRGQKNAPDRR